MEKRQRSNPDFLNGVPELLILQLLSRRPMHGYELVQSIKVATGEQLSFGEGCIYPLLHRMEKEGLLAASRQPVGGRSRIIYEVTARGKAKLAKSTAHWLGIVEAVQRILQGGFHGKPAAL